MTRSSLNDTFEELAKAFLAIHPGIQHEWRDVPSWFWGARRDLICAPDQPSEVFASLLGHQIALGATGDDHEDFEDFGRGLSDEACRPRSLRPLRPDSHRERSCRPAA